MSTTEYRMDDHGMFDLIRRSLELPADFVIEPEMTPVQIPGWDSTGWVRIIIATEETFGIEVDYACLDDVYSVGQFCAAVTRILDDKRSDR